MNRKILTQMISTLRVSMVILAIGTLAMITSGAMAGTISIDFPGNITDPAMVAGLVPAANWNNAPSQYGSVALVDNEGSATGATVVLNGNGTVAVSATAVAFPDAGDNTVMAQHSYATVNLNLDFAGIPYNLYDVYVYYNSGAISNHQIFSIDELAVLGGEIHNSGQGGPDSAYVESAYSYTNTSGLPCENGNYVVLAGLSESSFVLNADADSTRGSIYTYISGVQIVEVPEPSALFLLTMGAFCLTGFARRNRS